MNLKQIRNATMIIEYANKRFLIDPMLGDKGIYPPFPGTHNQHLNNPIVELPVSMEEILDVDAVIVTHIHLDHFDPAAMEIIPKDMKMFAQNEDEANQMKEAGFTNVEVLKEEGTLFGDIKLIKTPAKHYSDASIVELFRQLNTADEACGVVFTSCTLVPLPFAILLFLDALSICGFLLSSTVIDCIMAFILFISLPFISTSPN